MNPTKDSTKVTTEVGWNSIYLALISVVNVWPCNVNCAEPFLTLTGSSFSKPRF